MFSAFGVFVGEVRASKGYTAVVSAGQGGNGAVNLGLGSEDEGVDVGVPEIPLVVRDFVAVGGEDVVKEAGAVKEVVVVRGVFLVPEDGGDVAFGAVADKGDEGHRGGVGACEVAFPGAIVTCPG